MRTQNQSENVQLQSATTDQLNRDPSEPMAGRALDERNTRNGGCVKANDELLYRRGADCKGDM